MMRFLLARLIELFDYCLRPESLKAKQLTKKRRIKADQKKREQTNIFRRQEHVE